MTEDIAQAVNLLKKLTAVRAKMFCCSHYFELHFSFINFEKYLTLLPLR